MAFPRDGLGNPRRLASLALDEGLAAVVGSSPESIIYCSGFYGSSVVLFNRERPSFIVWPAEGDSPTLIMRKTDIPEESAVLDVRHYPRDNFDPVRLVVDVLTEKGLDRERIGLEMDHISATAFQVLAESLPKATFVDATPLMETLRMIKTAGEVDIMRRLARSAEEAIEEVFGKVRVGDTEKVIADELVAALARRGAESIPLFTLAVGSGSWRIDPLPSPEIRAAPGDLLRVDVKGTLAGYQVDLARNAVIRPVAAHQVDTYRKIVDIEEQSIDAVAPGIRACDLYEVFRKGYAEAGLSMVWGTFGHGIGLRIHEPPIIGPFETRELEPGMVLCLEPGYVEVGGEGYNVEDLVLVTEEGHQVLTRRRGVRELREVG